MKILKVLVFCCIAAFFTPANAQTPCPTTPIIKRAQSAALADWKSFFRSEGVLVLGASWWDRSWNAYIATDRGRGACANCGIPTNQKTKKNISVSKVVKKGIVKLVNVNVAKAVMTHNPCPDPVVQIVIREDTTVTNRLRAELDSVSKVADQERGFKESALKAGAENLVRAKKAESALAVAQAKLKAPPALTVVAYDPNNSIKNSELQNPPEFPSRGGAKTLEDPGGHIAMKRSTKVKDSVSKVVPAEVIDSRSEQAKKAEKEELIVEAIEAHKNKTSDSDLTTIYTANPPVTQSSFKAVVDPPGGSSSGAMGNSVLKVLDKEINLLSKHYSVCDTSLYQWLGPKNINIMEGKKEFKISPEEGLKVEWAMDKKLGEPQFYAKTGIYSWTPDLGSIDPGKIRRINFLLINQNGEKCGASEQYFVLSEVSWKDITNKDLREEEWKRAQWAKKIEKDLKKSK